MNQDLFLIALEFNVLLHNEFTEKEAKNLVIKSIKDNGVTEKSFLNLTRPAKKFLYDNTKLLRSSKLSKIKTIIGAKGDCYQIAFTKGNRGCANCIDKKMCKKNFVASAEPEPDVEETTKKEILPCADDVSFVPVSKIYRAVKQQLGESYFKESWVLLKDASDRERPVPREAVEMMKKLAKEEGPESVTKKSTFNQVVQLLKKHNLLNPTESKK